MHLPRTLHDVHKEEELARGERRLESGRVAHAAGDRALLLPLPPKGGQCLHSSDGQSNELLTRESLVRVQLGVRRKSAQ